jgi:hypothetical protein
MSAMSVAIAGVRTMSEIRVMAAIFWSRCCAASPRIRPMAVVTFAIRVLALETTARSVANCLWTAASALSRSASVSDSETNETLRGARIAPLATSPTLYVTVAGGAIRSATAVSTPAITTKAVARARGSVRTAARSRTNRGSLA